MKLGAGLGLLGLLVVVAIALVWFSQTQTPVIRKGAEAQNQARQIAGQGPDGVSAEKSFTVEGKRSNGKTDYLLVTSVVPGGALEKYLGLKKDDQIVQVGPMQVRESSEDLMTAMIAEAAQRQYEIIIRRNGQQMTLTPSGGVGAVKLPGLNR